MSFKRSLVHSNIYIIAIGILLAALAGGIAAGAVLGSGNSSPESSPGSAPATASTFTVTSTGDGGPGTLRQAINDAASGDTIIIPAGIYTLTSLFELTIDKSLTLEGAGSGDTIIQATTQPNVADFRVFFITGDSTVAISDVTIRHGNADQGGGIHNSGGTLTITSSTVSSNGGTGIFNAGGTLTLTNSIVSGNLGRSVGGIDNVGGTLTMVNITVSGNDAGGVFNSANMTINSSTVSGTTGQGIRNRGTLTIANSTVSGNQEGVSNVDGTLTITSSTVSGSTNGIGILNSANMTITNSTISGNTASSKGAGIFNIDTLTITNSTVSGNTIRQGGEGGAGILNGGTLTITNSTVSGNSATSGLGGGIFNDTGNLTITNSTVSGNSASSGSGGGIFNADGGTVRMVNTIIAGNTAALRPDCRGVLTSLGRNLIGDTTGCGITPSATGDLVNVDHLLGPLQDNGGPTFTHALLNGSPAIDAGEDTACPSTDQRGVTRPQGAHCDIGAFEFGGTSDQPPTVSITSPADGATVVEGSTITVTAEASDDAGVSKVEFFVDSVLEATDTTAPYSAAIVVPTGVASLTIAATATDTASQAGTASVTLNVTADQPPTVSITSPTDGATLISGTTITIAADASDNVGVDKVEFFVGTGGEGTDNTAPYAIDHVVFPGTSGYTISATATDTGGNTATDTISVNVIAAPQPAVKELFTYSVKVVCVPDLAKKKRAGPGLQPGLYRTAVNVHNPWEQPSHIQKWLTLSPPQGGTPKKSVKQTEEMAPETAFDVDCIHMKRDFLVEKTAGEFVRIGRTPSGKGFLVVRSDRPLDVAAVYTVAVVEQGSKITKSIDVEYIVPKIRKFNLITLLPGSDPFASPPPEANGWRTLNPGTGHSDGPFALPGRPNPLLWPVLAPDSLPSDAFWGSPGHCDFHHLHGEILGHQDPDQEVCGHGLLSYVTLSNFMP